MKEDSSPSLAILGAGNIGMAIARGLVRCGRLAPEQILLTRRREDALAPLREEGFRTTTDNAAAVAQSRIVVLCVQPAQAIDAMRELSGSLKPAHSIVVSVVTGVHASELRHAAGGNVSIVRAMPNTAIVIGESMTCIAASDVTPEELAEVRDLFDALGQTLTIDESQMTEATALCACGVAFFLRAVRAASQGGIEIGFHAEEALAMAAQTARGAASLLLETGRHPEREIDRVTTPMGCTIAGLNRMEHEGFSSALIKGIVTSAEKAETLSKSSRPKNA